MCCVQNPTSDDDGHLDSTFGRRVSEARERRGLSQRSLAERMTKYGHALDPSALSRIEGGGRPAKLSEAVALSVELGLDLGDLARQLPGSERRLLQTRIDRMARASRLVDDASREYAAAQYDLAKVADGLRPLDKENDETVRHLLSIHPEWRAFETALSIINQAFTGEIERVAGSLRDSLPQLEAWGQAEDVVLGGTVYLQLLHREMVDRETMRREAEADGEHQEES
ncbi:helix-turn-helix domain-containing protein [Rathayibacter sp. VKM Ac-2878]|nr:helix-turn-helix transcriptional regulator [Rathayibacter sp. VKM Ac-2878]